jgi:NADPH2 dehydrogenase
MAHRVSFPAVAAFRDVAAFKAHLATLPIRLACDDALLPPDRSVLAQPLRVEGRRVGNRLCIHAMGGMDGTPDGKTTDLVTRRWVNFGRSGAKLIWGGEAAAVTPESRDNPFQLYYHPDNRASQEQVLRDLRAAHRERFGITDDLLVGLQISHSGRYCRPDQDFLAKPRIAYRHPLLDERSGVRDDRAILSDMELDDLVGHFATYAKFAQEAGFDFVDVKQCHAYLLHEMLSAHTRPGRYGGSFENRTRLFREIVTAIRRDVPGLLLGTRVSIFDLVPFQGLANPCPTSTCYPIGMGSASTRSGRRSRTSRSRWNSCGSATGWACASSTSRPGVRTTIPISSARRAIPRATGTGRPRTH